MSAFTETALVKKLSDLNSSQQSIQTLSLWLIHHRKHHANIVKTWLREFINAMEERKLTFMYLANDVIQNSKKKGPEYGKEFASVLTKVFAHVGDTCRSDKLIGNFNRILSIWDDRGVYETKLITELRMHLNGKKDNAEKPEKAKEHQQQQQQQHHQHAEHRREKRKHEESKQKPKRAHISPDQNGNATTTTTTQQSPYVPVGEPPEAEELINAIAQLENSASSDAAVRERIANLPPELTEINTLTKLEDKEAARLLLDQVNVAVELLNDYNARLAGELEERNKLSQMLRDYLAEQKALLAQAEKRLEESKKKVNQIAAVQKEVRDHLSNLPDELGDLEPLPSAGDLFKQIHQ